MHHNQFELEKHSSPRTLMNNASHGMLHHILATSKDLRFISIMS